MSKLLTHFYLYGYGVSFLLALQKTDEAGDVLFCLILALTSWAHVIFKLINW